MDSRVEQVDERTAATPKRRVMAVGVRRAGGSWWIRSRLRVEPPTARPAPRRPLDDRAA